MKALSWSNWETESPGYQTDYCAKPKNPSLLLVSHYSCYDLHVSDSVRSRGALMMSVLERKLQLLKISKSLNREGDMN